MSTGSGTCGTDVCTQEGSLAMPDVSALSGISGLSFKSTFLQYSIIQHNNTYYSLKRKSGCLPLTNT